MCIQVDSKLLSEFPFIGHGNPDNNLQSPCSTTSNKWKKTSAYEIGVDGRMTLKMYFKRRN
jgi:hypothetical protein